jgi:hypothetical protein
VSNTSEKFIKAFTATTPKAECYFCNRVFISTNPDYFSYHEIDENRKLAQEHPDKYTVYEDNSLVHFFDFFGETVVIGCKCMADLKIELWIEQNKQKLLRYFGI